MKPGDALHTFDQELSAQLCGNVAQLMTHTFLHGQGTSGFVSLGHLQAHLSDELIHYIGKSCELIHSRFVLDEVEFMLLGTMIDAIPVDVVLQWKTNLLSMQKWNVTVGEVGTTLGADAATSWIRLCEDYEFDLGHNVFSLQDGLNITWNWSLDIRELLQNMGRNDCVPRQHGEALASRAMCSSPSHPDPAEEALDARWQNPDEATTALMDRLRSFLMIVGNDVSTKCVLDNVPGNRKALLDALQCLRVRGEYSGHQTRPKIPLRHRDRVPDHREV